MTTRGRQSYVSAAVTMVAASSRVAVAFLLSSRPPPHCRQSTCRLFSKKHKQSSRHWLDRHVSDPFVRKAISGNTVSRAYFKLEFMDGKYDFIQPNQTVVDLGAAPGGWSAYAANKGAYVLAIDLLELSDKVSRLSNVEFIQGDFTELYHQVEEFLQERKVAVVLSDMAPNFIGDSRTDAIRAADLCEQALEFSLQVLKPGGVFVGKLFSGPEESELKEVARKEFKKVTTLKPPASRRESAEKYLFAQGRRENPDS